MTDEWENDVRLALIKAANATGQGSLGFANEEVAKKIALILQFWSLGVTDGYTYEFHAEPMQPTAYVPHGWQVICKRRPKVEVVDA